MRKVLLSILLILTIVLLTLFMKNGLAIKSFRIYSLQGIADKNQELTQTINKANQQTDSYTDMLSKIKTDTEELSKTKKEYLDLVQVSTDNEIKTATQTKSYTIEYLWSRVGNHATKEGVNLKMDVTNSTLNNSEYRNLNFTVTGAYLALTQFIYSIENDANLDFTIDKFDMTANKCTFTVSDIKIEREKTTSSPSSSTTSTNQGSSITTTPDGYSAVKDGANSLKDIVSNTINN